MDFFHWNQPMFYLGGEKPPPSMLFNWVVCSPTHQNPLFPSLIFFPYLSLQRMFFDQQPDSKLSISPLTSIPFRAKMGIPVNTDVTVLPMDSTSKLNHIPKAMGWSNRWIPNEQIPLMTNVQLGHQSSISTCQASALYLPYPSKRMVLAMCKPLQWLSLAGPFAQTPRSMFGGNGCWCSAWEG